MAHQIGELLAAPLKALRQWKRRRAIWEFAEMAANVHHTKARGFASWIEREIYGDNLVYRGGGTDV